MNTILSIPIQYNGSEYHALVRFVPINNHIRARVTIMNGNVEKLLCGNNTFHYKNGFIVNDLKKGSKETIDLRLVIKDALEKHILESDLHEAGIVRNPEF